IYCAISFFFATKKTKALSKPVESGVSRSNKKFFFILSSVVAILSCTCFQYSTCACLSFQTGCDGERSKSWVWAIAWLGLYRNNTKSQSSHCNDFLFFSILIILIEHRIRLKCFGANQPRYFRVHPNQMVLLSTRRHQPLLQANLHHCSLNNKQQEYAGKPDHFLVFVLLLRLRYSGSNYP